MRRLILLLLCRGGLLVLVLVLLPVLVMLLSLREDVLLGLNTVAQRASLNVWLASERLVRCILPEVID